MQNVADAERMGGLARHIAEIARRRHPDHTVPAEVFGYIFADMGKIAVNLGGNAKSWFCRVIPGRPHKSAMTTWGRWMSYISIYSPILKEREWPHSVASAVDVVLLGRFYERFADHAVEIARRVIFQATGETAQSTPHEAT